jgi:hypothetical protein
MEYRYYRYEVEGILSPEDVPSALGDAGGMIVRVDNRDGRTQVTVATHGEPRLAAESRLGAGVEVSEEDIRNVS